MIGWHTLRFAGSVHTEVTDLFRLSVCNKTEKLGIELLCTSLSLKQTQ
jgi:hypothetical protein